MFALANESHMRSVLGLVLVFSWILAARPEPSTEFGEAVPGKFSDVTAALGIRFQHVASHTSKKYLIETMGSGGALFDFDDDGRLDIFLVNGAPILDPSPKEAFPRSQGATTGIVFTIRNPMARSKT